MASAREKAYHDCPACGAVFMSPCFRPSPEEERRRYEAHNNDVADPGYRNFARPIVEAVGARFGAESTGLDFGSGPGPVAAAMLAEMGYHVELYDPFFSDDRKPLEKTYDYVLLCEVMEHFHNPVKEFALLRSLLNPRGALICMTALYSDEIDFASWHYINDITHVFFYREKTLEWIRRNYNFSSCAIEGRVIVFSV